MKHKMQYLDWNQTKMTAWWGKSEQPLVPPNPVRILMWIGGSYAGHLLLKGTNCVNGVMSGLALS